MIGVLAPGSDQRIVSEFFELFKTPWENLQSDRDYEVILCVGDVNCDRRTAKLVLQYADYRLQIDEDEGVDVIARNVSEVVSQGGNAVVIYGNHLLFRDSKRDGTNEETLQRSSYSRTLDGARIERIGYDLFAEIAHLLTKGQPEEFAQFPTLDLHISFLRNLIVGSGIELLEIPPVPDGYGCIACLTHDIDHPGIKFHKWDATAFGFLYRALAVSFANFVRGRASFRELLRNWLAAAKLPFVYLGWAKDFWSGFEERYLEFEKGIGSTYFVVPFRNHSGSGVNGPASRRRATGYGAKDIKETLLRIKENGSEVALHGIDAWCDSESGRREFEEISKLTGDLELGVRMHWLFYETKSPQILENAGAAYDSTVGYRATVGFRNGTTQPYKPIEAAHLMELPLHIMDTALFFPSYLGLSQKEAELRVQDLVAQVAKVGGCLTINWHDRSLSSERNWERSYSAMIDELKVHKAWFATAKEAVGWFRLRRSVVFETDSVCTYGVRTILTGVSIPQMPGLRLRIYKQARRESSTELVEQYVDQPVNSPFLL